MSIKLIEGSFISGTKIIDTYCESLPAYAIQVVVTADNKTIYDHGVEHKLIDLIIKHFTALPSMVLGRGEGGLVKYSNDEGGDSAVMQLWWLPKGDESHEESAKRFNDKMFGPRARQGPLSTFTGCLYDAMPEGTDILGHIDVMRSVGACGDTFEEITSNGDWKIISIPLKSLTLRSIFFPIFAVPAFPGIQ